MLNPLAPIVSAWMLAQTDGAAPPDGAGPAATQASESITLWTYITDGGPLSIVFIALSITALGLIIRNIIMLRITRLAPRGIVSRLEELLAARNLGGALAFSREEENACFVTSVMESAITRVARSEFGMMEFRNAVEESAQGEADELHRMNDHIGIIAAIGPMLGLLGTTIGMIGAFRTIGTLEGAQRSNELATFMSMALVNTAEGLVIAIPCTVAFSLFRRRVDVLLRKMGMDLERLIGVATSPQQDPRLAQRGGAGGQAPQGGPVPAGARARQS
ncbi:MAG: MotA/TolQ/ExbB proton channel family protein [Phycisphaerales bacterium]|nr:MotA/TolQ/ExbB proton channel family protein [Phycisphaerales bacterium]